MRRLFFILLSLSLPLVAVGFLLNGLRAEAAELPPPAEGASCTPFAAYACTPELLAEAEAYAQSVRELNLAAQPQIGRPSETTQNGPSINVWHGNNQSFGQVGTPQNWLNILGNVSDPDGVASVVYTLNGSAQRTLALGPDARRLASMGDFNIDIPITDSALLVGANTVHITATDNLSNISSQAITVNYATGNVWPLPYSMDWATASFPGEAQPVDGLWSQTAAGLRPQVVDYDRLVVVGDINAAWDDWEITIPITVHSFDYVGAFNAVSSGPGVGLVAVWPGHSDNPVVCTQPKCGWLPLGAFVWFDAEASRNFNNQSAPPLYGMFKLGSASTVEYARDVSGLRSQLGVGYYWKARVERGLSNARAIYRLKVWPIGGAEPPDWLVTGISENNEVPSGSIGLLAHHADATFGNLSITPGPFPDSTGPVITDIRVARRPTSATVMWRTDEPATSRVDFGTTTGYGNNASDGVLKHHHTLTLTSLSANTAYNFKITSVDAFGNSAESANQTFTTPANSTTSTFISDDFNSCTLNSAWFTAQAYGDATFSTGGALSGSAAYSISVPTGTPHTTALGSIRVPRLLQSVADTNFDIEVKFNSNLTTDGQSHGLIVEQNGLNVIQFDFRRVGGTNRVMTTVYTNTMNAANSTSGQVSHPRSWVSYPISATVASINYLRVTRSGDNWQVYRSTDGSSWLSVGTFTRALAVTRVGVFGANLATALDGSDAPAYTAAVDYVFNRAAPITPEDAPALTTTVVGSGSIARNPSLLTYTCGQQVTLTATPENGWLFSSWSGALSGSTNPQNITLNAPANVTATFVELPYRVYLPLIMK
jgi:hypothetical protein